MIDCLIAAPRQPGLHLYMTCPLKHDSWRQDLERAFAPSRAAPSRHRALSNQCSRVRALSRVVGRGRGRESERRTTKKSMAWLFTHSDNSLLAKASGEAEQRQDGRGAGRKRAEGTRIVQISVETHRLSLAMARASSTFESRTGTASYAVELPTSTVEDSCPFRRSMGALPWLSFPLQRRACMAHFQTIKEGGVATELEGEKHEPSRRLAATS